MKNAIDTAAIENLQTPAEQLDEAYRQLDQMDALIRLRNFAHEAMRATVHSQEELAAHKHMVAFVGMCTAALQGEAWAVERLAPVLNMWNVASTIPGGPPTAMIDCIRTTDTTRPDDAIARSVEV